MKTKIKILIGTIITIITTCIFLITTHAQEGYTINNNGNIESLNLQNNVIYDTNETYSNNIQLKQGTYTLSYSNIIMTSGAWQIIINNNVIITEQLANTTSITFTINEKSNYRFYANRKMNNAKFMLNLGTSPLNYFPYGLYTGSNNPVWNNVEKFEFAFNFNYIQYNTSEVYKYISPNYWDFEGLLNSINIESTTNYAYDNYLNITFKEPINISNFKYILTGPLARMTETENYYIGFAEKNNQNNFAVPFNTSGATYEIEIPNNFMLKAIDMHWVNTEQEKSWPNTMNAREYDIGYRTGYEEGYKVSADRNYNNGYANGLKYGLNEGEQKGIEKANSTIDPTSASYIEGYNQGEQSKNNLSGMVFTIVESPINIFKQIFDFNILGFDITQVIFSLLSLLIIVFIIKKLIR